MLSSICGEELLENAIDLFRIYGILRADWECPVGGRPWKRGVPFFFLWENFPFPDPSFIVYMWFNIIENSRKNEKWEVAIYFFHGMIATFIEESNEFGCSLEVLG
jgi:hypothetical protein